MWERRITEYLILNRCDSALHDTSPIQRLGEDQETFQRRLNTVQKVACTSIRNRVGYNGHTMIRGVTTVSKMLEILETFKPEGVGAFQDLCKQFSSISLSEFAFMASSMPSTASRQWIFDTGCNQHICNSRDIFTELKKLPKPMNMTGVNNVNFLTEGGTVQLTCSIGNKTSTLIFNNVVYFPKAPINLISINVLRKQGHKPQFTDISILITHNSGQCSIHDEHGMLVLEILTTSMNANNISPARLHAPDASFALQACNTK